MRGENRLLMDAVLPLHPPTAEGVWELPWDLSKSTESLHPPKSTGPIAAGSVLMT